MSMTNLKNRFDSGLTFDEFVLVAKANTDLLTSVRSRAMAPPEYAARVDAVGRRWRLLVVTEDWCGDGVNIVPWVDALAASSPNLDLRIIRRDLNLDVMDKHLTGGRARAIPLVLLLDDSGIERAWWGPRPTALQSWFMTREVQAMEKGARYKELRRFYARDRGRSVMEELTTIIESVAASGQDDASSAMVRAAV